MYDSINRLYSRCVGLTPLVTTIVLAVAMFAVMAVTIAALAAS